MCHGGKGGGIVGGIVGVGGVATPGIGGIGDPVNGVGNEEPGNRERRDGGVRVPRLTPAGEKKLEEAISENVLELS